MLLPRFRCDACGHEWDAHYAIGCPNAVCGNNAVRWVMSRFLELFGEYRISNLYNTRPNMIKTEKTT